LLGLLIARRFMLIPFIVIIRFFAESRLQTFQANEQRNLTMPETMAVLLGEGQLLILCHWGGELHIVQEEGPAPPAVRDKV
jgi:hypothetical protein